MNFSADSEQIVFILTENFLLIVFIDSENFFM